MQRDVKVNKGMYHACVDAFKKYGCLPKPKSDDLTIEMSRTLVCMLEKEAEMGDRKLFGPTSSYRIVLSSYRK